MSVDDRFLSMVQAMHEAALDGERWPLALRALADLFDARGATLEVFGIRPMRLIDFHVGGLPTGAEIAYLDHYAQVNTRAAYAFRHLSRPILYDYPILDERGMDRDPYYAKYLDAIDLRYFMSGQIVRDGDTQGVITIQRSRRQGHVDRHDVARMRRLLPHARQAYDVATRLRNAESQRRSLERAFDWLADGVLLLRRDGGVVYVNAAARDIVGAGDGIRLMNNVLQFTANDARTAFEAALGAVLRLRGGNAADGVGADTVVPRPSGRPAYVVLVRPLFAGDGPGRRAEAMVFIRDPLRRQQTIPPTLRVAFGLTDAEADVAQALLAGIPLGVYARQHAVSLNTVYTHLRRLREKTGCRRLTELIRRLNDLQVPLRYD